MFSEIENLVSDLFVVLFEFLHPGELFSIPPGFSFEARYDVGTTSLSLSGRKDMLFVDFGHEVVFDAVKR